MSNVTARTQLLLAVDAITNIVANLNQSPSQLTIVTRTWSGGQIDQGSFSDVDLVFPPKLLFRQVSTAELNSPAGRFEEGDLHVRLITPNDPANPGVGYTEAQIAPAFSAEGIEVIYQVTGQHAGHYTRLQLVSVPPYEYQLYLRRRRDTPLASA